MPKFGLCSRMLQTIEKELAYNFYWMMNLIYLYKPSSGGCCNLMISIEFLDFNIKSNLFFRWKPTYAALILDKKKNVFCQVMSKGSIRLIIATRRNIGFWIIKLHIWQTRCLQSNLETWLVGKTKINVSTDGIINFINIPALPIDKNAVLGDKFDVTILTSNSDIITGQWKKAIHTRGCSIQQQRHCLM